MQNPESPRNRVQKNEPTQQVQEPGIRIDGYQQVLDLLRVADPAFRESLMARMAQRNPALVKALREALRT